MKCGCPVYCKYCGRRRSRDSVGHYCKTPNCQWQHGFSTCRTLPLLTGPKCPYCRKQCRRRRHWGPWSRVTCKCGARAEMDQAGKTFSWRRVDN